MEYIWNEYVKDFWRWCKKYKIVYFTLGTIMGIYILDNVNEEIYKMLILGFKVILEMILSNVGFFIYGVIVIVSIVILLRKSDKEFQKELDEAYPDFDFHKSENEYPIKVYVSESMEYVDGYKLKIIKLKIKNMLSSDIESISGKAEFYNYDERVKVIDFDASDVRIRKIETIYKSSIAVDNWSWDELYINIDNIKSKEYCKTNLKIGAISFRRTHFTLLNRYNYISLGRHRLPYEITWLRDKMKFYIMPWIKWQYKIPVRRESVYSKKEVIIDYIRSYMRIICVSIISAALFIVFGFLTCRFILLLILVIIKLLKIIVNIFWVLF